MAAEDFSAAAERLARAATPSLRREGVEMQKWIIVGAALLSLPLMSAGVEAKGCLKGAAVGGVAGHMVGKGHGVAGAAAGCAIGHHEANKKAKQAVQQNDTGDQNAGDKGQSR